MEVQDVADLALAAGDEDPRAALAAAARLRAGGRPARGQRGAPGPGPWDVVGGDRGRDRRVEAGRAQEVRPGVSDPFEAALAQLGRRHVGATLGLIEADGTTRVAGTGRTRLPDGPAPGADTIFEIGSITKTFTALMLAEAVVQDRIRLDTPVRDLLPPGSAVPSRDGAEITVEQLARHTSGLPRSPGRIGFAGGLARPRPRRQSVRRHQLTGAPRRAGRHQTPPDPGRGRMRYSNFGAGLLGTALVAAVRRGRLRHSGPATGVESPRAGRHVPEPGARAVGPVRPGSRVPSPARPRLAARRPGRCRRTALDRV